MGVRCADGKRVHGSAEWQHRHRHKWLREAQVLLCVSLLALSPTHPPMQPTCSSWLPAASTQCQAMTAVRIMVALKRLTGTQHSRRRSSRLTPVEGYCTSAAAACR